MEKLKPIPIRFFFTLATLFLVFSSPAACPTAEARGGDRLLVKIGVYENKPKIYTEDDGRVAGFWPDLIAWIAKKENWDVQYVHGSWNENLERLKNGQINIMPDVAFTELRRQIFRFTEHPVLTSWSRIYVGKNNSQIKSITDLRDRTIAVLKGSVNFIGAGGIKEITGEFNVACRFLECDDYQNVFKAVETGRADAGVTNREFGNKNTAKFNLKKTAMLFQPASIKFALTKGAPLTRDLAEKIDSCLAALLNDDTSVYYQLLETYFESKIARTTVEIFPQWLKTLLKSTGVLFAFLIVLIFVSRAQVKRKTHEIWVKNKALIQSEAHLRTLIETIPDLIWLKDPHGRFLSCNKKFERFLGAKEADILGKTDYDFLEKDLADCFRERDRAALFSSEPSINQEQVTFCDDGHTELLETIKTPMYDGDGNLIGVIGIARDITRIKQNEKAVRREKEFTETALNSQKDTFFLFEPGTGKAIRWNRALTRITGYTDDEILRMKAPDAFFSPEDLYRITAFIELVFKTESGTIELDLVCKDGRKIPMEYNVSLMKDDSGAPKYLIAVGRDLTERNRMEDELRQSHKMESIGTLAGGIAHDFNNILGIILGNAELALRKLPQGEYPHGKVQKIRTACLRAKEVVRQLLSFSKKSDQSQKPTDIAPIAREAINLIRSSIPSSVEIVANLPQTTDTILADSTQIHQVLINLCTNASHAMADRGGVLEVILRTIETQSHGRPERGGTSRAKNIELVVKDTGSGIAPSIRNKIFDPYFTTKETGKGSGMGLSVVHGIVKSHNGQILVDSEPGKGTRMSILFPVIDEMPRTDAELPAHPPEKPGRERILFVDDEAALTDLAREILTDLGYEVTACTSPSDALALFSGQPDGFDVVITDMTMPQMNGMELSKKLKQIRPDLPIIICTGNRSFVNDQEAQRIGISACITKPVKISDVPALIASCCL